MEATKTGKKAVFMFRLPITETYKRDPKWVTEKKQSPGG